MGLNASIQLVAKYSARSIKRIGLAADLTVLATVPLLRISGGDIEVVGLHGQVVGAANIGAGAATLALTLTGAIGGIAAPIAAASAAINGNQPGTVYTITGAVAGPVTIQTGAARGVGVYQITNRMVLVPGVIGLVVGGFVSTGLIDWYLEYRALGEDAVVAAL